MGGAAMVLGRLFHQEAEMSEPGRVCINRRWWERDVVEGVWISDGGLDSPDVDDWPAACRQIADLTRELEEARAENARLQEARDRLQAALQSIANNTCCTGCGEAALVARAALKEEAPMTARRQCHRCATWQGYHQDKLRCDACGLAGHWWSDNPIPEPTPDLPSVPVISWPECIRRLGQCLIEAGRTAHG